MLSPSQGAAIVGAQFATYSSSFREQIDEATALAALKLELDERIALNEPGVCEVRAAHFCVPGAGPDAYREQLIELAPYGEVLAGIRHVSGNRAWPYVDVWPSFVVSEPAAVKVLVARIREAFQVFEVPHVKLWVRPKANWLSDPTLRVRPMQSVVAGRIDAMPRVALSGELELRRCRDDSYLDWYKWQYDRFHRRHPELRDVISVNGEELMEAVRTAGLLYELREREERVGLIGSERLSLLGIAGLLMVELLIREDRRRRGWAMAMQACFVREVANHETFVWGTIDARNVASRKTAERLGRRVIQQEVFIPVA